MLHPRQMPHLLDQSCLNANPQSLLNKFSTFIFQHQEQSNASSSVTPRALSRATQLPQLLTPAPIPATLTRFPSPSPGWAGIVDPRQCLTIPTFVLFAAHHRHSSAGAEAHAEGEPSIATQTAKRNTGSRSIATTAGRLPRGMLKKSSRPSL